MKITAYLFMVLLCLGTPAKAMTMADLFAALKDQPITKLDTLQADDSALGVQAVHDRFYPVLNGVLSYEQYNSPTNFRPVTPTESAETLAKDEPLPFSESISRVGGIHQQLTAAKIERDRMLYSLDVLGRKSDLKKRIHPDPALRRSSISKEG